MLIFIVVLIDSDNQIKQRKRYLKFSYVFVIYHLFIADTVPAVFVGTTTKTTRLAMVSLRLPTVSNNDNAVVFIPLTDCGVTHSCHHIYYGQCLSSNTGGSNLFFWKNLLTFI